MPSDIDDLIEKAMLQVREALREAFARGCDVGASSMRESIIRAATAPTSGAQVTVSSTSQYAASATAPERPQRAARGVLQETLIEVLRRDADGGLSLPEIEERVMARAAVAKRSIYGELHRKRGELYEQHGSKWFLKGRGPAASKEETAGTHVQ